MKIKSAVRSRFALKSHLSLLVATCFGLGLGLNAQAQNQEGTRMLSMPASHGEQVAFVYDNDLWLGRVSGGQARRLTSSDGREMNPVFSPDGETLAFNAPYDGHQAVYVMPAQGGAVKRLTWHPGDDIVLGFTPDGHSVLFSSPRSVHTRRYRHLYTVPVDGGIPERLPVPTAFKADLSPDGKYLAYVPAREAFHQWKNYRGGTISRIWVMSMDDYSVQEIPKPAGGSNDTDPMWINGQVYFTSDRDGEFNLYRFDPGSQQVSRLTEYQEFPVISPNADDNSIVFEQAGRVHRFDVASGRVSPLNLQALSPLQDTLPRQISDERWVSNLAPSPDLNRVAVEYRGEIVTVAADKGDPRVLAANPAAHDRNPVWSPKGDQVAWFSDADGEYALYVMNQDGRGEPKRYDLEGAGYYDQPHWSPDGRWLAYRDNSQAFWATNLKSGKSYKIGQESIYTPVNPMTASWSPDSRWLAYTLQNEGLIRTVYAWNVDDKESIQITDGLSETAEPVFDANGEFLYVLASTDAGPVKDWFSQTSADARVNYGLYAITLRKDGPHPLPPQSDEAAVNSDDGDKKDKDQTEDEKVTVQIDLEGLNDRITPLPVGEATRIALRAGKSGEIYYIETQGHASFASFEGPGELKRFTLKAREASTMMSGVATYELSADGEKVLYNKGSSWFVSAVGDELKPGKGKLDLGAIVVNADPRAEWAQIFNEAWRINRDWFYDPNFHGADWPAMREKYAQFLPHLASREDLDRVIRWMLSELSVGHSYLTPGEYPNDPEPVPVGLLGADYEVDQGRYRFAKIYGGLNWNADLHAPLRKAGVEVNEGDYLIAVNGREVKAPDNLYRAFMNQVGRQVSIKVADNPAGRDAREYTVLPVARETSLRYLDWLEGNLRYVNEKTDGRVAYVHVPNTADYGYEMFKRYFYPQSHKDAIIVDERYNGGGLIADYYIDILRREYISHWNFRYGNDLKSPRGSIQGPKVMLADEGAGSGGDLLPWMFQQFNMGPVIGKRTWGGLVGILGFPPLMDGGSVTAPNLGFWTEDGFRVENEGVAPDIEVEQWPADVNAGRDPQLDKAIEVILNALEEEPPVAPQRPDYPVRVFQH